jgi:phosphatidylglycerol---prolipoprotein diacylglyceryl transferase
VLAVIPYTTFPIIELGPLHLRTFGLMVALGVLLGSWVAAIYIERFGVPRDETYRVATYMVLAGIAIWEGGIQFSGGFIFALLVGLPFFKRWNRLQRWHVLDGYSLGLALGLAVGRIGCYAVGEHFGRTSSFFLATRYDGGDVREGSLGDTPLTVGTSFHNTALYEMLYMFLLFAILGGMVLLARRRGRELLTGTIAGIFLLYYGIARFLSDALRVNDERVAGLTGAQWMCIVAIPAGLWILWHVRPSLAEAQAEAEAAEGEAAEDAVDVQTEAEAEDAEIDAEAGAEDTEAPAAEGGDDDAYEPAEAGTDTNVSTAVPIRTSVDNASGEDEATVPDTER